MTLPTTDIWLAYTVACILIILAPGPDSLLAVGRGLGQGRLAALVSALGTSAGLMVHVVLAALGLSVIVQTSDWVFTAIKLVGGGYLLWLGVRTLLTRDLIAFTRHSRRSLRSVFMTGFLTNVLNPKPIVFILAFIPQFVIPEQGAVGLQILGLGTWYGVLAFLVYMMLGGFASTFANWLERRPYAVFGLNVGAGLTFLVAGFSIVLLERK